MTRNATRATTPVLLLVPLLLAACGGERKPPPPAQEGATPSAAAPTAAQPPLIPRTAALDQVNALVKDPARSPLPEEPHEAAAVKLGYDIVRDTKKFAPKYVGNELSCANCHMNAGQRDRALPYVGIAGMFPEYRSRDDRLISLEDRISDCFKRSLNGTSPPYDSPEMMAVSAYITWLSDGIPVGENPEWRGQNRIAKENLIPIEQLDTKKGEQLYVRNCSACHGADGQGVNLTTVKPGPLWGPESWNDGAGAARVYTLAGYIRYAMPLTVPGSLSDEESQQVAAYINAHERPVYAAKAQDYPASGAPVDAVYYPRYPRNPLAPAP